MNNLVIMNNQQAVTSTTMVSETFEREHYDVIKSVERLKKDVGNFSEMFYCTKENDSYGRDRKVYLMNRDGFTLLAMGFTGKKAMQFKLKYIEAFNEMEKQQPKVLSEKEQLMASMKLSIEANETLEKHDERITNLEDSMRIDSTQEFQIRESANIKVVECLGGKESKAYKEVSRKTFSRFWSEFKKYFKLPRYGDLPKKKFNEGMNFIINWQPDTLTRMEIDSLNKQMTMEVDAP